VGGGGGGGGGGKDTSDGYSSLRATIRASRRIDNLEDRSILRHRYRRGRGAVGARRRRQTFVASVRRRWAAATRLPRVIETERASSTGCANLGWQVRPTILLGAPQEGRGGGGGGMPVSLRCGVRAGGRGRSALRRLIVEFEGVFFFLFFLLLCLDFCLFCVSVLLFWLHTDRMSSWTLARHSPDQQGLIRDDTVANERARSGAPRGVGRDGGRASPCCWPAATAEKAAEAL